MRCDVLAVGTELLLGQLVDTNGAWLGEQLAAAGIDSHLHMVVGDNQGRVVEALRHLLAGSDAVIVTGGLGPTPDDLTREAVGEVMGDVPLRRDEALVGHIREMFASRGRPMPPSNLRQADIPVGARSIPNPIGTAPGLLCPVGERVIYAVPGVPYEMQAMVTACVVPDLLERAGERSCIVSRSLRTWGLAESALAERIATRVEAQTNPTIAFLARGVEGIYVRLTAKAATTDAALGLIAAEEAALRAELGDIIFGADDESMESVVVSLLRDKRWTLGIAESVTGGYVGGRISGVPGCSDIFRGVVVSYAADVKRDLLGVKSEKVVSAECAMQMAEGARRALDADAGLAVTGVAGPAEHDGEPVGTVYLGLALPGEPPEATRVRLPGDRHRIQQFSAISLLDFARRRLLALPGGPGR